MCSRQSASSSVGRDGRDVDLPDIAPIATINIAGAGHLAWADIGRTSTHPDIAAYSLAFLEHYVKGRPPAPILTQPAPGVARLYYDSELGRSATGR